VNPDVQILRGLRMAGEAGASGAALAKQLGVSRAAVWNRIEDLRRHGYEIEASPHHGYILRASPDALHGDDLMARLTSPRDIGRDIRVFTETASTNDVVEKLARDGLPEGAVVFAEAQSGGRGRLGRTWVSPAGVGLWFSILLRPRLHPTSATQLTVLAAVAVARAIERQTELRPAIKWPNDVLVGHRKVAGILLEMSTELDRIRHAVLGIGIDVNVPGEAFPQSIRTVATSLAAEAGHPIDRPALATQVLAELDHLYARLNAGDFHEVGDEWMRRCSTLGQHVTIHMGSRAVAGRAEALDEDGALLVRTEHGVLERIVGGDVTLDRRA
jgi:BirA family biotin operon repressor/biotin-[acetyl-CoA-carboxylase] ligase